MSPLQKKIMEQLQKAVNTETVEEPIPEEKTEEIKEEENFRKNFGIQVS